MRGPLPNDIRLLQPTLARRFALLAASQMITISLRSPSATFARASSSCAICTLSFMLQMQSGTRREWSSSSRAAFRIVIQGKWSSFFLSAAAIMVTAQCLVGSVSNILIMGITTATLLAKGYRGVLCGVSGGSSALPKLNSRKYKEEFMQRPLYNSVRVHQGSLCSVQTGCRACVESIEMRSPTRFSDPIPRVNADVQKLPISSISRADKADRPRN